MRSVNLQEDIHLVVRDGCLEAPFVFEVDGPFYTCGVWP